MKNFIKKYKYILLVVFVLAILAAGYYFFFYKKTSSEDIWIVKRNDFVKTITVSGKVVADKNVEIGFNRSGKISQVFVQEGQRVEAGQLLVSLDSRNAQLSLDSARLDLQKMIEASGSTQISGLAKNYEDSLANINKTFLDLPTIMDGMEDILSNYQTSPYKNNLPNDTARQYYNQAFTSFYKTREIYNSTLAKYQNLKRPLSNEAISSMNESTYSMLQAMSQSMKDANTYINYTYDITEKSSRTTEMINDRSDISAWLQTINNDLSVIGSSRNTLKNSNLDIEGQKLTVDQREHDLSEYFLRAPFSGVVTRLDAKVGETVSSGQISVAMINDNLFQIESYVPEVSIADLKIGNPVKVTLDAYGPDVYFDAKIVYLDPAETLKDGVSTYKIKLQFVNNDSRIRSGMTANAVITSENKPNIISVPANAINTATSGEKYVQIKAGDALQKRIVTTGLVGSLGQTEISSGLKEGDIVVIPAVNK